MAIKARCPKCKRFRSLETVDCDCGQSLREARKKGEVRYYARFMVNGVRKRLPLGNKLKAARAEEARLLAEYADSGYVKSRMKVTVDEYYKTYFLPEQKRKNRSWSKAKSRYENHLKSVFGHMRMMAVEGHHVQEYINVRLETKDRRGNLPQPATVNRELAVLKRLFNQARADGLYVGDNPFYGKSAGAEKKNYGQALTKSQAAELIKSLPQTNIGLLIEFLLSTGLRFTNAARLEWTDVDMINARVRPIQMKAGIDGIPLSGWAMDILKRVHKVPGCIFVFPHISGPYRGKPYGQVRRTFKRALKEAGLDDGIRIHDLRHSFGSWLGDERVNEKTIAALLNHKQTSTTSRYTHPGDDALRVTANCIQRPEKEENKSGAQGGAQNGNVIFLNERRG